MKHLIITLALISSFCYSWALPPPNEASAVVAVAPSQPPAPPPPPTLTQDLEELYLLVPSRALNKLVIRYLLNDAQFQAVIRIINSHDAFMVRMRLSAQPEVIQFKSWVRSQLILSGGGSLEFEESEEILRLFNPTPYWSVYGWQGFFSEFLAYFPFEMLRARIDAKVMLGGSMAQFWTKVKALLPVYERVLAFPESKRLIAQLEENGVVFHQLDQFIRSFFDWYNVNPLGTQAIGAGAQAGGPGMQPSNAGVPASDAGALSSVAEAKNIGAGTVGISIGTPEHTVGAKINTEVVVPAVSPVVA